MKIQTAREFAKSQEPGGPIDGPTLNTWALGTAIGYRDRQIAAALAEATDMAAVQDIIKQLRG